MAQLRIHNLILYLLIFFAISAKSDNPQCVPTQIHLSLGDQYYTVSRLDDLRLPSEKFDDNQATLIWITKVYCNSRIRIVKSDDPTVVITKPVDIYDEYSYNFAQDEETSNTGTYRAIANIVFLNNLQYETEYKYDILNLEERSLAGPFSFTLRSPNVTSNLKKILFLGDTSQSERWNKTLDRLTSEMNKDPNAYAGLVHLGDFAYDIQDENGKKGDDLFQSLQNIASQFPLIITPGNHDDHDHWDFLNFRVRDPLYSMHQNQYFSFNWQGIHFLSINFDYYDQADFETQEIIYSWVERDLHTANDPTHRALWPWVVVFSHRPIYCMHNDPTSPEDQRCSSLYDQMKVWDALFNKFSVDLMISSHLHSYERMGPIYKNQSVVYAQTVDPDNSQNIIAPTGTIFIIEGVGGNDRFLPNEYGPGGYGFFVNRNPGYGALSVINGEAGELKLRYEHYDSETGNIIDAMNIIKRTEIVVSHNVAEFVLIILGVGLVCLGVTLGFIKVRRWKQNHDAEDTVPLNKTNLISTRLRYNRPGQTGLSMVDL